MDPYNLYPFLGTVKLTEKIKLREPFAVSVGCSCQARRQDTFKQNLVNYQKWTTTLENIQYLRKLVMLKVFHSDLDENIVLQRPI